jgi:hypothetical protein
MEEDDMMKNSKMFMRAAAVVLIVPLSIFAAEKRLKISIQEILSIGALDDEAIFQWTGVAADADGFIYVLDGLDYSLKKFDARGKLVKKAGRKGQGPGEFLAPRLLACSQDFLYATDQTVLGISVFDKELQFKKRIPFSEPVTDLFVLSDTTMAIAVMGIQGPGKIVVADGSGRVQTELAYQEKYAGPMMDSVSAALDGQGHFYLAYVFQDRIESWDRSGKRLWSKNLLGIKKVEMKKIDDYVLPTEVCYKDVSLDDRGRLFVLAGKHAKNPSRDVYVLSPSGEWLSTLTLPDTTHCIYIDRQNFLYARANQGITLKKYRLIYE